MFSNKLIKGLSWSWEHILWSVQATDWLVIVTSLHSLSSLNTNDSFQSEPWRQSLLKSLELTVRERGRRLTRSRSVCTTCLPSTPISILSSTTSTWQGQYSHFSHFLRLFSLDTFIPSAGGSSGNRGRRRRGCTRRLSSPSRRSWRRGQRLRLASAARGPAW